MRMLVLTIGNPAEPSVLAATPSPTRLDDLTGLIHGFDAESVGRSVLNQLAQAIHATEPARDARSDLAVTVYLRATDVEL